MSRLDNIEKINNKNTSDISKVERITIKVNTENFLKLVTEIPILINQAVNEDEI